MDVAQVVNEYVLGWHGDRGLRRLARSQACTLRTSAV